MNQNILKYLNGYSYDIKDVNRLLVSSFLNINKITEVQNLFIKNFIITSGDEKKELEHFCELFENNPFTVETLIELFEFVISPQDKEVNGAVFTPEYIRKYIVLNALKKHKDKPLDILKFGDIACGCGGFFKTITEVLIEKTSKSYFEIYRDNIYGLDIQDYSIVRTKILLCLIAIKGNEDSQVFEFNLFCGNALSFDWNNVEELNKKNGFDIIVGNPPYVGVSKMDDDTRTLMKLWKVSSTGKPDLYIPFFEIGMENLNPTGILGYITVNTFYKSLNGRAVRDYFSSNEFDLTIIDFGGEQLFKNRSTYTCICIIGKDKNNKIKYIKSLSDNINNIKPKNFVSIPYSELDDFKGWYLVKNNITNLITKIEKTGISLGDKFVIRNGFATLRNKVYVFKPTCESDNYFHLLKDKVEYKIEKGICRNAIKPNILKSETEINGKLEKIIFPYKTIDIGSDLFDVKKTTIKALSEMELESTYPNAYQYLLSQKKILSLRDKGKKEYEAWFAFGRNQALTLNGYKLLLPYITSAPCFVFTDNKELLFYNGFAIFSESIEELLLLQKILMSKIFWFYVKNTSKPYEGDYFSVAKRYIKNFGVCDLSNKEKKKLIKMTDKNVINDFLFRKYDMHKNDLDILKNLSKC